MWDVETGVWSQLLTMLYDLMVRECSGCGADVLVVTALEQSGPRADWKTRKVYKRSCGCGRWLNDRGDHKTMCPEGALFVFEEES